MSIARGVRGPGRLVILRSHRLEVFFKVFSEYVDGRVSMDDVVCRAMKLNGSWELVEIDSPKKEPPEQIRLPGGILAQLCRDFPSGDKQTAN